MLPRTGLVSLPRVVVICGRRFEHWVGVSTFGNIFLVFVLVWCFVGVGLLIFSLLGFVGLSCFVRVEIWGSGGEFYNIMVINDLRGL